jgi:ABC-type phosphate transport system substrate-binding protein
MGEDDVSPNQLVGTGHISGLDELSGSLNSWVKLNRIIREHEEVLRDLKQKKTDLQYRNLEFMKVNDLDSIQLSEIGAQVNYVHTRNKVSNINKTKLPIKLEEFFKTKKHYDNKKAEELRSEIMEFLDENPEYRENSYLKLYEK